MDEKDQNSLTISDILEQLVKPSIVQGRVQPPQSKPVVPSSALPSLKQEQQGNISLPQLNKQELPKSISKSSETPTDKSSDRRLTTRTMRDDLVRLKRGLAPIGLELEKLEIQKNIPNTHIKSELPLAPTKVESIPLEALNKSTPSSISDKPAILSEKPAHIHEEVRILDKDNLPAFLGAPIPKKMVSKSEEERVEYGVIAKIIGSGMTTGIVSTVVLAVIIYGLIYYFFLREEAIITPTPIPTPVRTSPITEINELEEIFRTTPVTTFSLPSDLNRLTPELQLFLEKEALVQKEFKRIRFLPTQPGEVLTFPTLLNKLAIKYPVELSSWLKNNSIVFLYGQMEKFNDSDESGKRWVFIIEIKDANRIIEIMRNWETTMSGNLKDLFIIDPLKEASGPFLDNEYKTAKIRYKNFPLPDKTIDYAIVSSLTGRYYLILTNSRESMYSPIDRIKGI